MKRGRPASQHSGPSPQRKRLQAEIGKRIRNGRQEMGLSQALLAERISVGFQQISVWERGKTLPDLDVLVSMAAVLRVAPGFLAFGEGKG